MKLSLSNCSNNQYLRYGYTQHQTLGAIRNCGFSHIDLDLGEEMEAGDVAQRAKEMRALLDSLSLTASMAHGVMVNPVKRREEAIDATRRGLLYCKEAGIPLLVVHPGAIAGNTREEFFDANASFYRALIPFAEESGVCVLVENIGNYADPYYLWNGADLCEMLDRIDHPLFGACWDIGHANHFYAKDCDQYTSILALGDKLRAIHAHDNCGYITDMSKHSRLDMHTFPIFGNPASVNWDAVLQGLVDVGYKGTFNFETIAPAASDCAPFYKDGERVTKLRRMSLSVWQAFNQALYEMGKAMLSAYDVYEG